MHFTVVIPTRERASTLEQTLKTCVAQDYDDLEILVSDNASADNTRDVAASFSDRRIRYVATERRLSMTASFEFAFSHVKPGYLISIGDDDGIPAGAIRAAAQIARETGAAAITTERAQYDWPGMPANRANQILFSLRTGWERRQTQDFYSHVLNGWLSYYQIPLLYHCYVTTRLIDSIRARLGSLFHSQQLDIYSSMLLGGFVPDYVHSFVPLVINGASTKSNGAQHFGAVTDASEIKKWKVETDIPLRVPFRFARSHRYLILESFLQARDLLRELDAFTPDFVRIFLNAVTDAEMSGNPVDGEIVRDVARLMGYPLTRARWPILRRKLQIKAARYYNRATHLLDTVVLDCGKFRVNDIAGAARLMAEFKQGAIKEEAGILPQFRLALKRS